MGLRVSALARKDRRFAVVSLFDQCDAVIDFTAPAASVGFARQACRAGKPVVIGTTGFTKAQYAQILACARRVPVFLAPNMSPGVNLMYRLAAEAAKFLPRYKASILETHHIHKKDAPSGTALRLAEAVRQSLGGRAKISIASKRIGSVVGEHTLTLTGPDESLKITHHARSRDVFARGSLEAALWVRRQKPGLYEMLDMLKTL